MAHTFEGCKKIAKKLGLTITVHPNDHKKYIVYEGNEYAFWARTVEFLYKSLHLQEQARKRFGNARGFIVTPK
jgi:hypothetical protein